MSTSKKLNVCIIGCGDMGRTHAAGWKLREDAEIVAVSDPLEDRRTQMAENTGATPYPTYQDAILHEGVNVVSVCVPVCFHSEVSCFAMRNRRHVLCEKPLALTMEQADEMVRTAKETGMLLSTSFQYRGYARNVRYRKLFQEGAFGGPIFVRYSDVREVRPKLAMHRRSMNGGPVIDMAGHYFDFIRFITGEEPVSVFARGHVFGKGTARLASVEDFAIDAADVQVTMTGGHVLNVFVNWGMPEGYSGFGEEVVIGPKLSARATSDGIEVLSHNWKETWDTKIGNPPGSSVRINDLAEAIIEGRQPEVTGDDGRAALKISLAALESIETGNVIKL